jgi:hypothetical protein
MLIPTAVSAHVFDWSLVACVITCPPCMSPKRLPVPVLTISCRPKHLPPFPHADSIPARMVLMTAVTVSVTIPLSSGHVADCLLL